MRKLLKNLVICSFICFFSYRGFSLSNNDGYSAIGQFGEARVFPGKFIYEAKNKPWSSDWLPLNKKNLFSEKSNFGLTNRSTLSRYEKFAKKETQISSGALKYERNQYKKRGKGGGSFHWEGLCIDRALAAVSFPGPINPAILRGVKFRVGDTQALLTKSIVIMDKPIYGKMKGDEQDIYPDNFHRFIQVFMGERKESFVMDYDNSSEVWAVPVYKVKFNISWVRNDNGSLRTTSDIVTFRDKVKEYSNGPKEIVKEVQRTYAEKINEADSPEVERKLENDLYVMRVSVNVFYANFLSQDAMDVYQTIEESNHYVYELYGNLITGANGEQGMLVKNGRWADHHVKYHPDFLVPTPTLEQLKSRRSDNPEIKVELVDKIYQASKH